MAHLKERGFRFTGYIMSDGIRRCTVDKWGRVEWPDFQPQAEAKRLRNGLYEFLGDLPRVDTDGTAVITVRAVIKRVQAILDSAETADEMKGPYVPKRWRRVARAVVECHECRNNNNPLWCDDAGEMECCHCDAKLRAGESHADECPVLIAKAMLGET